MVELFGKEFQAPRHQFTQNLLGHMTLQKQSFRGALKKMFSESFLKFKKKTPALQSLFQ